MNIKEYEWLKFMVRINKKVPAVTRVEEWTRAEMGVGAAMAAGSQAENGNCALFVHAAMQMKIKVIKVLEKLNMNSQLEDIIIIAMDRRIKISPNRFERMVISPDLLEEGFW